MKIKIPGVAQPIDISDLSKLAPAVIAVVTAFIGVIGGLAALSSNQGGGNSDNPPAVIAAEDIPVPIAKETVVGNDGVTYQNAVTGGLGPRNWFHENPGGKYKRMTGTIGFSGQRLSLALDPSVTITVKFIGDGKTRQTIVVKAGEFKTFDVNIAGVKELKVHYEAEAPKGVSTSNLRSLFFGNLYYRAK